MALFEYNESDRDSDSDPLTEVIVEPKNPLIDMSSRAGDEEIGRDFSTLIEATQAFLRDDGIVLDPESHIRDIETLYPITDEEKGAIREWCREKRDHAQAVCTNHHITLDPELLAVLIKD